MRPGRRKPEAVWPSPPAAHRPQTFLNAYFWLLASLALGGAAVPLLGRVGDALGQPKWEFKVPEGLLLNEEGDPVTEASLKPSAVAGVALALGVTTWDALHHSGGFTMNNLVRGGGKFVG